MTPSPLVRHCHITMVREPCPLCSWPITWWIPSLTYRDHTGEYNGKGYCFGCGSYLRWSANPTLPRLQFWPRDLPFHYGGRKVFVWQRPWPIHELIRLQS